MAPPLRVACALGLAAGAATATPVTPGAAPAYGGDLAKDFDEWLSPGAGAPKKSPHLK